MCCAESHSYFLKTKLKEVCIIGGKILVVWVGYALQILSIKGRLCGLPAKSVVNLGNNNISFDYQFQSTVTYCLFPSC